MGYPLTRPAPAEENAGAVHPLPQRGEGWNPTGGLAKDVTANRRRRIPSFGFRISILYPHIRQSAIGNLLQMLPKPFEGALGDVPLVVSLPNHMTFIGVHHELGFDAEGF